MNEKDYVIPQRDIESLARCLLPQIQKYFESEDGQKEFAEWQAKQKERRKTKPPPVEGGDGIG
jgi:hypothetical protein